MISMLGFLALAWQVGGYNELLAKVVWIDVVASVLLAVAMILFFVHRKKGSG